MQTYLKHDLLGFERGIPSEVIYRLWRMIATDQGSKLDLTKLSGILSFSATTVRNYLGTLSDSFLLRILQPWHGNTKKRLIKTPKIYVRDSGLLHALVGIRNFDDLCSHSIYGHSWEGFCIEQILQQVSERAEVFFYGSSAGAEIDLVLEIPRKGIYAVEIKRTVKPTVSKGFRLGCEEIKADHRFYVIPTKESFPLDEKTTAIGIEEFISLI